MKTPNAKVRIACGTNLKTNERTIEIEVLDDKTAQVKMRIYMTPQDFAETLVSHVDRPAYAE